MGTTIYKAEPWLAVADNSGTSIARLGHYAPPNMLHVPITDRVTAQYAVVNASGHVLADGALSTTVVLGRHSAADCRLHDERISLRHALLVCREDTPSSVLVFNLAEHGHLAALDGTPINAMHVQLPALLRLGEHFLILKRRGVAEAVSRFVANEAAPDAQRFLFALDDLSGDHEGELAYKPGRMEVTGAIRLPTRMDDPTRQVLFRPTLQSLARGVMIGRYERCEVPDAEVWDDRLSRVHALLFASPTGIYIADLGSVNGTRHEQLGNMRLRAIEAGDTYWLGRTRLEVEL